MTVDELIEELKWHDPNALVVCRGYMGGYIDVKEPAEIKIVLNYYSGVGMGPHEEINYLDVVDLERSLPSVEAICIG